MRNEQPAPVVITAASDPELWAMLQPSATENPFAIDGDTALTEGELPAESSPSCTCGSTEEPDLIDLIRSQIHLLRVDVNALRNDLGHQEICTDVRFRTLLEELPGVMHRLQLLERKADVFTAAIVRQNTEMAHLQGRVKVLKKTAEPRATFGFFAVTGMISSLIALLLFLAALLSGSQPQKDAYASLGLTAGVFAIAAGITGAIAPHRN